MTAAGGGADVIVASRKLENCEAVAEECRALGRKALAVSAHAGKWPDCADELPYDFRAACAELSQLPKDAFGF